MADVVRLKEWLSRSPRRETIRRDRPAEVLLFTGVRYERAAPEPGKPPATSGNKRKRG